MDELFLGIDGGGTRCRARLCAPSGAVVGVGSAGPANIRYGLTESFAAVTEAASQSLTMAGLPPRAVRTVTACLALAGATEPACLDAARKHPHPFGKVMITSDAHAACMGAHGGRDGGVVVVGTGSIGMALAGERQHRVGGWGFPVSDEGSGAWLGLEALRRALWACDGRTLATPLLDELAERFASNPHSIVRFMTQASPRDVAAVAPRVVAHAAGGDETAVALMRAAAGHIEALLERLSALGAPRLALAGGLAASIEPWLRPKTRRRLSPLCGDALDGALQLARSLGQPMLRDAAAGSAVRETAQ